MPRKSIKDTAEECAEAFPAGAMELIDKVEPRDILVMAVADTLQLYMELRPGTDLGKELSRVCKKYGVK